MKCFFTELSSNSTENTRVDHPAKVPCAASSQIYSGITAGKAFRTNLNSAKTNAAKGPEVTEHATLKSQHSPHPKSFGEIASSSVHFSTVGSVNVTLRKHSREEYLMGAEAGKASERFTPQATVQPLLLEEAPVRDDGQSDWSLSSNGSTFTSNIHLMHSYTGKNSEPVNSLSQSGPAEDDLDFGSTIGSNSDVTVYKEIARKTSGVKPMKNTGIKLTKSRQPIPGSEDVAIRKACPKSLLSQFTLCQQDSGFDSPVSKIQK